MDYIRYAANNNHIKAQNVYDYYRKDISKFISKSISKSTIKHLINDSSFDTNFEFSRVLEKIKKGSFDISTFDIDKQFFKEFNFIPTEDALKRLAIIKIFIETGTHLIIEGPTGTSKTFSIEIVCKYLHRNLIRVNLSSDTKSSNLTANIANKQDEWSSIGIDKGPFLQAYENGDVLLLDEINLANPECVRFINDTLDHDQISTQFNGEDIIIEKNPNFVLIATQNPNKGSYSNKRKDLPEDFKSRFIIIEFPELSEKELTEIAKGLAKKHKYEDEEVVKKLVEFHIEWSKENTNDILCFTIREIASTIQAIASGDYSFDAIMNIYGARYEVEKQKKLEQLINKKYPIFKRSKNAEFNYFSEIPNCKKNSSLSKVFNSLWSSIKRGRHVIVASKSGNGATFITREFAHWYQKKHSFSGSYREHFHVCTIDTNNSYLIGKNKPSEKLNSKNNSNQLIEWHDGFLIKAIKDENIAIFDNIDEALPTILERLNSLLDKKVGEKFETFENPNEKEIEITEGFRLLCTCKLENLEKLSPAFVNRFDVIVLGDQIERNKDSLEDLITILLKQAHGKLSKPIDDENQTKTDSDSDDDQSDNDNDEFSFKFTKKIEIKNDKFIPNHQIIDLIYDKIKDFDDLNMRYISQLCNAIAKFQDYFKDNNLLKEIIEFSIQLLDSNNQDLVIPKGIKDKLLSTLLQSVKENPSSNEDGRFFFENSPPLQDLMVKVFACSLINLHVRITGPTGAGKTSFAREFARIRPITLNKKMAKFLMQSFSSETKPIDCFLKPTIKDKQFGLNKGPLLLSMVNGLTIILDEFNLSLPSTMKSIAPALEPIDNKEINISGIDDPIVIHPNLFIIICENETNYRGRNNIPSSIEPRFRLFKYPELEIEDLSSTAIDISNSFYDEDEIKSKSFSNEEAGKVGEYMYKLNKSQIMNQTLSIRDLTKFFIQIHHQDVSKNDYQIENRGILKDKNMKLYMNLLFYTFASISRDEITKMFDKVLDLIGEVFLSIRKLNNESKDDRLEELEKCFYAVPKLKSKGNKKYLEKGIFKIYSTIFDNITLELPSLLNGMFQILLCDPTEPILLVGPSGMKSFLAQQFLKNATLIALHSESTINQLLGASAFFNKEEVKLFYINYICKVCNLSHKIPQYIEKFMNGTLMEPLNKEEFRKEIEEIKMSLPESFRYSVTHLLKKLFDEYENKSRKSSLSNIELEFKPGLFLSAILEGKSLILKNLSNLPTNVLERFNELFSIRSMITLNEDTHGTIVSEDKRELTEFNSFLKIFATCSPDTISQLSEAVLSRFSVIWISSYEKAEQELVLESYVDVNKLKFDKSNFISKIIKFSNEMERVFHKSFSFPQMINIIEMCSRLNKHTNES